LTVLQASQFSGRASDSFELDGCSGDLLSLDSAGALDDGRLSASGGFARRGTKGGVDGGAPGDC